MIEVHFDREAEKLTVRGHAGSAEQGKDLVCAGASMLVFTLADTLKALENESFRPRITLEPGYAVFDAKAENGETMFAAIAAMFTVCCGFRRLAAEDPQFVRFTEA